ncbi:hypothetical protein GUA87_04880 [Sneathiella sp. P13V-1]|uniref:hypothetical protein n=1 Tax=Sneathiella sp. P13V-1 TaxID=2697366 RepID=UPI00187B858D|nr:hypothetical protein [Sneathiella sp. P13V-1]MBE7636168.1 hypothetical protein [Sneathiella sp. P13V-1]
MFKYTSKILKFGLVASTVLSTGSAVAASAQYSEYIESISFERKAGVHIDVVLENVSPNKHVDNVKIFPKSANIPIEFDGTVRCEKDRKVDYHGAKLYFGDVSLFVDMINVGNAVDLGTYFPSYYEWTGTRWANESGNNEAFNLSLLTVKNLPANLRIDPVAELNKKLQAHMAGGKSKASFYQKEQFIELTRPVTLAAACEKYISAGKVPKKWGYRTANVKFVIRYAGDPEVNETGKLNPVLGNNQPGGGNINQNLPLQLTEATFQPNIPHYIGKCVPNQDPKIRFNFKGSGKGSIQFIIEDGSSPVYSTPVIAYDSKSQHNRYHDFDYPLKAKMAQKAAWKVVNQTINHNLKIRAKVKTAGSNDWGPYQNFGQAVWKHRCTPQTTVPGSNGGKVFNPQNSNPGDKLQIQLNNTSPKPARKSSD